MSNNVSAAQFIESSTGVLKVPGLEEFFFTEIPFKEEMRQMEKNNNINSSNSLVFCLGLSRWPQTKIF